MPVTCMATFVPEAPEAIRLSPTFSPSWRAMPLGSAIWFGPTGAVPFRSRCAAAPSRNSSWNEPLRPRADSRMFVRQCNAMIAEHGWKLGNADITVVCERPRIGPHASAMRGLIAADLGVAVDAISVKATTTEQLGFTGRAEGIAAQAVCLLVPK